MPTKFQSLCVFCGSSPGARPEYVAAAQAFGRMMAVEGIQLVYGGGNVGLMGVIADTVLESGGDVVGIIPQSLADKEVAHQQLTTLHVVQSMHERKALMAKLADGFVVLPGGFGTLEEMFEVLTWTQLGFHRKPCGLLNVSGFYDKLTAFLDHCVEERFIKDVHRGLLLNADSPEALLEKLMNVELPKDDKWMDRY